MGCVLSVFQPPFSPNNDFISNFDFNDVIIGKKQPNTRLSTIVHADRILLISKGEILESGTHRQLIDSNGEYARLWNEQLKINSTE